MDAQKILNLYWKGRKRGIGEPLVMGWVAAVLQDNGVLAYLEQRDRQKQWTPIDPNIALNDRVPDITSKWYYINDHRDRTPAHLQYIRYWSQFYGALKVDWVKRNHVPVKYYDIPVQKVDVALNTKTGKFTLYKWWPYFSELKQMLKKAKISFIDLDADWRETYGIRCLNYVKRASLYVGLDTGMAHYVSKFANGKALIINGGYVEFEYWSHPYDFEVLQIEDMPCRPCILHKNSRKFEGKVCEHNQRCMREISPAMVFNRIVERLNGIS